MGTSRIRSSLLGAALAALTGCGDADASSGQAVEESRLEARSLETREAEERIFADSVWLAPGELRAWELRPGWYSITVDAKAPPGEAQPLELAADLVCVPDALAPKETITCRVKQNTRLMLRHRGAGRSPARAVAVVTITRLPR